MNAPFIIVNEPNCRYICVKLRNCDEYSQLKLPGLQSRVRENIQMLFKNGNKILLKDNLSVLDYS